MHSWHLRQGPGQCWLGYRRNQRCWRWQHANKSGRYRCRRLRGCLGCLGMAGGDRRGVTVGPGEAVAGSRWTSGGSDNRIDSEAQVLSKLGTSGDVWGASDGGIDDGGSTDDAPELGGFTLFSWDIGSVSWLEQQHAKTQILTRYTRNGDTVEISQGPTQQLKHTERERFPCHCCFCFPATDKHVLVTPYTIELRMCQPPMHPMPSHVVNLI